ncbi:MAG TPA: endonuclease/exonuclease/phosphatase family protein [Natronosporangium sp.]|nr:endonuclease/exonuclease/phosphatase family protein [Natronosporangium sp.]
MTTTVTGLRVLSYNIAGRRGDRAAQARLVRHLAPDVALVQEAPRRLGWRHRCAALAHAWGMVVAVGGMPAMGNLVLTSLRVQVVRTWCVRFPLTPGRHLRGAAFAHCRLPDGGELVAVGAHLATDAAERPAQADRLRALLDELRPPVVLGADVNDEPGSHAWRALSGRLRDPAAGLAPVATFPRSGRRIDAVFVDGRLTVTGYRVVDTPAARAASDHLPVVADLEVPGLDRSAPARDDAIRTR